MHWAIGLAASLLLLLAGVNRKLHLGLTMFAAGLLLLLVLGAGLPQLVEAGCLTVTDRAAQILLLSLVLIELLGNVLKQTGSLQRMITYLGKLVGDLRLLTALLPALVGVLTVPGGAIFSAPLVAQAGEKAGLSPVQQAAANLWFRHAFYFSFPLFPSMLLAAELSGVGVGVIAARNLPVSVLALIAGFCSVFRSTRTREEREEGKPSRGIAERGLLRNLANFAASIAPLAVVLLLAFGCGLIFPAALAAGIAVALLLGIPPDKKFPAALLRRLRTVLLPGIRCKLALVVLGIMFFKQSLEYSGVTGFLADTILDAALPLPLLMFVFPALIGFILGDNNAAVAIVFPLFMPLLDQLSPQLPLQVSFLFFSSAWSHIFTPVHPCFSLTAEYFKVSHGPVIRLLLLPAAAPAVLAALQVFLLGAAF